MLTGLIMTVILISVIGFIVGVTGLVVGLTVGIFGILFSAAVRLLPVIIILSVILHFSGRF